MIKGLEPGKWRKEKKRRVKKFSREAYNICWKKISRLVCGELHKREVFVWKRERWRHCRAESKLYCGQPNFSRNKTRRVSCIDRLWRKVRKFQQVRRRNFFLLSCKSFFSDFWEVKKEFRGKTVTLLSATLTLPKKEKKQHTERRKEIKNIKLRCVAAWVCVLGKSCHTRCLSLPVFSSHGFFLGGKKSQQADMICYTTENYRLTQTRSVWRWFAWAFPNQKAGNGKFSFSHPEKRKRKEKPKGLCELKLIFPHFSSVVFCYFSFFHDDEWMGDERFFSLSLLFFPLFVNVWATKIIN